MLLVAKKLPEALAAFEASAKQEPRRFRGVYGAARTAKMLNDPAEGFRTKGVLT